MARIFSDAELAELARPRRDVVASLARAGDADALAREVSSFERACRGQVQGYLDWIACTQQFVAERHGLDGTGALVRAQARLFAAHPDAGVALEPEAPAVDAAAVAAAVSRGPEAALAAFDALAQGWRRRHDFQRDLLSALLTHVYATHGADALEAALRHAGENTLMRWIAREVERPAAERIRSMLRMTHGHFTSFSVEEDDEKFTIVQDPCGSCGRQILQGRYGPPLELAVVRERHAVTGGRGEMTVYRCHVPVMHDLLPQEQLGFSFPVVRCPNGLEAGPCRVTMPKLPAAVRAAG